MFMERGADYMQDVSDDYDDYDDRAETYGAYGCLSDEDDLLAHRLTSRPTRAESSRR